MTMKGMQFILHGRVADGFRDSFRGREKGLYRGRFYEWLEGDMWLMHQTCKLEGLSRRNVNAIEGFKNKALELT